MHFHGAILVKMTCDMNTAESLKFDQFQAGMPAGLQEDTQEQTVRHVVHAAIVTHLILFFTKYHT